MYSDIAVCKAFFSSTAHREFIRHQDKAGTLSWLNKGCIVMHG